MVSPVRMLNALNRRVRLIAARAVLRALDDAKALQRQQVEALAGELIDGVERFQNYGLTSVPKAGAEAILLSLNGDRAHSVVIVCDDKRYRLTGLAEGEVAMYDDLGQKVHLTRTGIVVDTTLDLSATVGGSATVTATVAVTITAPTVTIDGDLSVTGAIDCTGDADFAGEVRSDGVRIDKTHKHGGVVTGPNQTSVVV